MVCCIYYRLIEMITDNLIEMLVKGHWIQIHSFSHFEVKISDFFHAEKAYGILRRSISP